MKNSFFRQIAARSWELACDHAPPGSLHGKNTDIPLPYAVYVLPCWGALTALAALLFGKLLTVFFPASGGALVFAAVMLFLGEWRTSFRGLALTVSTADLLLAQRSWRTAVRGRTGNIRQLNGIVADLATLILLTVKFTALTHCFRLGVPWFAGIALTAALTAEGFLATRPDAAGNPGMLPGGGTPEAVLLTGGFFLLWSLIFLPAPTLFGIGPAALTAWGIAQETLHDRGRLVSDDITFAGYLGEFQMLLAVQILL